MRESRLYGFVRGARGNLRPYRDCSLLQSSLLRIAYVGCLRRRAEW